MKSMFGIRKGVTLWDSQKEKAEREAKEKRAVKRAWVIWGLVLGIVLYLGDCEGLLGEESRVLSYRQGGEPGQFQTEGLRRQSVKSDIYLYIIPIQHGDPEALKMSLSGFFPEAEVSVDPHSRSILLKTTKGDYRKYYRLVKQLDLPREQIRLHLKIIEVNYEDISQYQQVFSKLVDGISLNYDMTTKKLRPAEPISTLLQDLTQSGEAKVLAKPSVLTQSQHSATVQIGDKIPYVVGQWANQTKIKQVHFLNTGIQLNLLPRIIKEGLLEIEIDAKLSSVKFWKDFGDAEYPVISRRQTTTKVLMPNKETLVIAGLFETREKKNKTDWPLVSWIPIVGDLFTRESTVMVKSDVIFMITPEIIDLEEGALELENH